MTLQDATQNATPTPTTDTGTGQATGQQAAPARTFTQADLDRIAGQAREEGRQAAARDAEAKRLAEQGEYQKLYEQVKAELDALKPVQQRVKDISAALEETVKAEIEQLPEDARALVPEYDDPRKTLAWLNANKARLVRQPAPSTDAGARGDSTTSHVKLTAEQEDIIRKTPGMTRDKYIARMLQLGG